MTKRSLVSFVVTLLLVSWAAQGVMIYFVRDLESSAAVPWLVLLMFVPSASALIYRFGFNKEAFRHVTFRLGNPLYLVLAALIPAATALLVLGVVHALGWGHSEYFAFSSAGVEVSKGPWLLGLGSQGWITFAVNIAVTATAFAAANSIAAVGEEFCWRGFLQGPMVERFGVLAGIGLLGLIWAFWHLPAILAGYNYPETPVLGGLVLFPLLLTADSLVMAWLTIRARSFWPAVIMHGSINGVQEGIQRHLVLNEGVPHLRLDITVVIVAAVFGAACLFALLRHRHPARQTARVSDFVSGSRSPSVGGQP